MTKCTWKKRVILPYRVEYECKMGKELLGKKGIMALQDQFDIRDGKPLPKGIKLNNFGTAQLDTWSVITREYKTKPQPRQTSRTIKTDLTKKNAIKLLKNYIKQ
jgi:hypothetical protein